MDIFKHIPPELVTLAKKDGRRFEGLRALVQSNKILTNDPKIPIEDGDEFIRTLPSGTEERYTVIDAGFQQGYRNIIPPSYESIVRKSTAPRATASHTFNLSGPNSRVNIDSHDASTNIVSSETTTLFTNIRQAIQQSPLDSNAMQRITERVDAMEAAAGTKRFAQRYTEFVSSLADHADLVTTIAPFLPALSQLLT